MHSFLAAIQVDYADTFTARLETSLSAELGRRVRVVNTGVAGWSPDHYLRKVRDELARRPYDLVLVFLYRGNDAVDVRVDHRPPKQAEIVHHFRRPASFAWKELVEAWLHPVNDAIERRSHLFVLARHGAWQLLMRLGLSSRGFPKSELVSEAASRRWPLTAEICRDIADDARGAGVGILFVLLPGIYHVDREIGLEYAAAVGWARGDVDLDQSARRLGEELRARRLEVIDTTPALRRETERGVATHGQVDSHLSPAGHAAVARALHPVVLERLGWRGRTP